MVKTCQVCNKTFEVPPCLKNKACSRECGYKRRRSYSGEGNPAWKGGRVKLKNGYIVRHSPDHPNRSNGKNPWVYEHRLIMEEHLGRYLDRGEVVHHLNKDVSDNRIENLGLLSNQSEHAKLHAHERSNPMH